MRVLFIFLDGIGLGKNDPETNPFVRATSWHVPQPIDLAALRNASIPLVGTHDFTSFCKRTRTVRPPTTPVSFVRAVRRAEWSRAGEGMLVFEIEARSFGRQMVRSIVGTLVDIGLGRRRASDVPVIMAARDRNVAGSVAPPHGLILWLVRF